MRRFTFLIVFILVLAMALPGCGGKGGDNGEQKGQLGGKIYKKGTTDLITSAVAVSIDGKSVATTSGEYLLTDLTTGNKTLQATAPGYKAYSATVTINPGSNTHDIEMEAQTTASFSLSGKIYNEANEKLLTSKVTVSIEGVGSTTTTTGEYLITDLTMGEFILKAEADGFEPYTATVTVRPGLFSHDIYLKRPGLVAHYKFNGDAQDSSGNGNHGTVYGATLVPDRFGQANGAYSFDGKDDYIEVEHKSFIKEDRMEISVAAWMKSMGNPGTAIAVFANDFLIYESPDKLGFSISTPSTKTVFKDISYNQWVHFVGTYDGTKIKIYINGAADPAFEEHQGAISNLGRNLNFGRDLIKPSEPRYWRGIIDDFRIYDRVLTAEEINELASHKP